MKKYKNLPSYSQWKQVFKILSKNEKIIIIVFFILAFYSSYFLISNFYIKHTYIAPDFGGIYIEGVKGQPRFINPIYAINDVDRDLTELLFSGLMKYDSQGKLIQDMAENYTIKDQGKVYEFCVKQDIIWSDNKEFSVDDIIFTIKTIQNPDYKSPLRANWIGVEVKKVSDQCLYFKLQQPYAGFLERLTLKILPKHIWQDISPQNFVLSLYNLQPISCGPYKLQAINQNKSGIIESLDLEKDQNYFDREPYLSQISFIFFEQEQDIIQAAEQNKINGFSLVSPENYNKIKSNNFSEYSFVLPRYFAIFFNSNQQKILVDKEIRKALNYGTNKQEIIEKALMGRGEAVDSPILPKIYGQEILSEIYEYDTEKAKEILEKQGFKTGDTGIRRKIIKKEPSFQFKQRLDVGSKGEEVIALQECLGKDEQVYPDKEVSGYFGSKTKSAVIKFQEKYRKDVLDPYDLKSGTGTVGKSTRKKLNEICFETEPEIISLEFSLITVQDPVLKNAAEIIKEQWSKIGVELKIQEFPISALQYDFIKPRNYEMLLFGEVLGVIPDPYPFWHSLQKRDPGLNLSLYENKKTDKLLEQARESMDQKIRQEKYQEFQKILIEEAPCVFLYSANYIYLSSPEVKGIGTGLIVDPSKRFSNIEDWHIETKRKWK